MSEGRCGEPLTQMRHRDVHVPLKNRMKAVDLDFSCGGGMAAARRERGYSENANVGGDGRTALQGFPEPNEGVGCPPGALDATLGSPLGHHLQNIGIRFSVPVTTEMRLRGINGILSTSYLPPVLRTSQQAKFAFEIPESLSFVLGDIEERIVQAVLHDVCVHQNFSEGGMLVAFVAMATYCGANCAGLAVTENLHGGEDLPRHDGAFDSVLSRVHG